MATLLRDAARFCDEGADVCKRKYNMSAADGALKVAVLRACRMFKMHQVARLLGLTVPVHKTFGKETKLLQRRFGETEGSIARAHRQLKPG